MVINIQRPLVPTSEAKEPPVLSVEGVSKKFCRDLKQSLFYGVQDIAADLTGGRRHNDRLRKKEFWALRDINFQLQRGQALGLVGANGAGKSTLLRILSGLIKPDTGLVRVRGRIAPLIALGAGFNPILSGRENIYANMSILGLSTREIKRRFDDVIDFAEIWDAIDAPVQSYSSGMAARLGFACAVHIDPEILLIDEVLAVGDIKFKMKCHQRLAELREKGTSFILVSHNPYHVLNVCDTSIYLKKGELVLQGDSQDVIRQYERDLRLDGTEKALGWIKLPEKSAADSLGLDILSICFKDKDGKRLETLQTGEYAELCVECKAHKPIENVNVGVMISCSSGGGDRMVSITSNADDQTINLTPGYHEISMKMPYCCLLSGVYSANIYLKEGIFTFDKVKSFRFQVDSEQSTSRSLFFQPRSWEVKS